jgi:hypothetical protein
VVAPISLDVFEETVLHETHRYTYISEYTVSWFCYMNQNHNLHLTNSHVKFLIAFIVVPLAIQSRYYNDFFLAVWHIKQAVIDIQIDVFFSAFAFMPRQ